jgi:signal transduction histidine kinase
LTHKIYLCNSRNEDLLETNDGVIQLANVKQESQFFPIQLTGGSQLEREYFLLILSEPFSGLMVAQQIEPWESLRPRKLPQDQPLSTIFTLERQVIQRAFEGIKEAIAVDDSISEEVLEFWKTRLPQCSVSEEKTLLSRLLVKQIQRMEERLYPPTPSPLSPCDSVVSLESTEFTPLAESATPTPAPPDDSLRNKDEFLKRVIQELRTPLTNMKTALKLLDSAQLKPLQRQRYMQLLNIECDHQNSLMTGWLELIELDSESQPLVMPSVQLADMIPGVVSTYQPIARDKGIQLGYTMPPGLPAVSCLETWLRQILINLLHNSLKFTLPGGQVNVHSKLEGDYVQVAFDDTGIGIAAHEIPRIFDFFYRGRSTISENTGAGLGLAIVQHLLLRCQGSISVTSQVGAGSTFKVLLPVASPTAPLCQGRK